MPWHGCIAARAGFHHGPEALRLVAEAAMRLDETPPATARDAPAAAALPGFALPAH